MNFSEFRKFSWLVWLLVGCLAITGAVADDWDDDDDMEDEDEGAVYVGTAKGSSSKGIAEKEATIHALMKCIKAEMEDPGVFETKKRDFLRWLKDKNRYDDYVNDSRRVGRKFRPYGKYKVRVKIDSTSLLKDIAQLTKAGKKTFDWKVVIFSDGVSKNEHLDRDIMFDTVQSTIGRQMEVYFIKDLRKAIKDKLDMTGVSSSVDPSSMKATIFNTYNIRIKLWVTTKAVKNAFSNDREWHATVGGNGTHIQTGRALFKFQLDSIKLAKLSRGKYGPVKATKEAGISDRMARKQAIESVSLYIGKKILYEVANVPIIAAEDQYNLTFNKFSSSSERQNINRALLSLTSQRNKRRPAKMIGGGASGGQNFTFRVKWLRTGMSAQEVASDVTDRLSEMGVMVQVTKATKGEIFFEPAEDEEEDMGGF